MQTRKQPHFNFADREMKGSACSTAKTVEELYIKWEKKHLWAALDTVFYQTEFLMRKQQNLRKFFLQT